MILHGDCLEQLASLDKNSVHALITDPPAGISFMGKSWDDDKGGRDQWISWLTEVMKECLRVMKPGAHGLVWAIPRTSHWTATALENAGFEVRDVVTHLFGSGFPKSHDISKGIDKSAGAEREVLSKSPSKYKVRGIVQDSNQTLNGGKTKFETDSEGYRLDILTAPSTDSAKQWQGWGTAMKPAVEMWLLVAKPFTTVPLDAIISEVNSDLRGVVCQQLDAKCVQKISMSNLKGLKEEQSAFAQWISVLLDTIPNAKKSEKMVTFKSPEMERTCLNIGILWKGILDVLLNLENKFITKMETDLITELKILKFSISEPIQDTTIKVGMNQSGQISNVTLVESCLKSALLRLRALMEIIVPENVLEIVGNLSKGPPRLQNYAPEIAGAVLSEHYILIRKPCSEKTVAKNVLKHGVGGINIDGSRIGTDHRSYSLNGNIKGGNFGNKANQPASERDHVTVSGRFPANLVFSHSDFCTDTQCDIECAIKRLDEQSGMLKSGQLLPGHKQSGHGDKYSYRADGIIQKPYGGDSGGASRFFYCAKASKTDKNAGLEGMEKREPPGSKRSTPAPGRTSALGAPRENFHPTVKSTKLMQYLIKLITPPNGVVLDPFMGSGSTGVACKALKFKFIGIEKEKEYFKIAEKRMEACL